MSSPFRVVVCCKQVPDTSARLQVKAGSLVPYCPGILPVMNPYDEFALEEALRLREAMGQGEIVLLTLSREPVEETVFHGLAMGADRSIVLHLSSEAPLDPLATGLLLSGVVKEIGPDLIFCGERAVDDDAAQVGPIIAGLLDLPQICAVEQVVMDGMNLRARCRRGDVVEVRFSPLPCVVTFVRGRQLPRYPSLDDIFMADGKPQECRQVSHSEKENVLNRVSLAALAEDRGGEIISCESPNVAVELLLERIEQMTHIL